ncbi:MAG TPA: hypothetical protein VN436_02250 [Holophaga sp.]|nr:hypothetical protein [Holophaga sp.]
MASTFIEVKFDSGVTAYQEVSEVGEVVAYRNPGDGAVLADYPPVGDACRVTNVAPEALSWMAS